MFVARKSKGDSPDLADALVILGALNNDVGAHQAASEYLAEAYLIRTRISPASPALARVLYYLGGAQLDAGDAKTAVASFKIAIEIFVRGNDHTNLALSLYRLGLAAIQLSDWKTARDGLNRSTELLSQSAPNSPTLGEALVKLGAVEATLGNLADAKRHLTEAVRMEINEADSEELTTAERMLAAFAWHAGDFTAARIHYERVVTILRKHRADPLQIAKDLFSLGQIAFGQKYLQNAERFHRMALEIWRARSPQSKEIAAILKELGVILREVNPGESELVLREAITVLSEIAPGTIELASALKELGLNYLDRGDNENARSYFKKAIDIYDSQAPDSLELAGTLNGLSVTQIDRGDLGSARHNLSRAFLISLTPFPM